MQHSMHKQFGPLLKGQDSVTERPEDLYNFCYTWMQAVMHIQKKTFAATKVDIL